MKRCKKAPLLYILPSILFFISASIFAREQDIAFNRITLQDGLSQSIVECITQDRRGFMWIGTEDGLNLFDGYQFTILKNDPDDDNSLSYNQVQVIFEDKDGVLWIGTFSGGLNRYDPVTKKFTRFQYDPYNQESLSNDIVLSIFQDRDGYLWIGTQSGLNRLDPKKIDNGYAVFKRYMNDPNDKHSISDNLIRAIAEDKSGRLWIGSDNGLNRMTKGDSIKFIRYYNEPGNNKSLSHNSVRCIYKDKQNELWVGTDGGMNKVTAGDQAKTPVTFERYFHQTNEPKSISHNEVYAILEDQDNNLWIGTNGGGLNRYDRQTGIFHRYRHNLLDNTSLSYDEIRCLYEDKSGVLWIGTYGGNISRVDKARKKFCHHKPSPDNPNSLNQAIVWCLYEDRDGILWIGTHGGGLNRFDRKNNQYRHYLHDPDDPQSISHNVVRLILEDKDGYLWLGTNGGGICRFDRKTGRSKNYRHDPGDPFSLSHNEIRALFLDQSGTIWIGTRGGGLNKMIINDNPDLPPKFIKYKNDPENPQSLSNDFIRTIFEDKKGRFWIGTLGGGLNLFDRENEIFTHYRTNPEDRNSISSDYVFSFHEDKKGLMWIGTWGGGLNSFNPESGQFMNYTEKDGLPSNSIYGNLEDEHGNLWLSTNNGLCCFNQQANTFRNYNVQDGLQSSEFNGGSFFKSNSGEMFFGGINGFNAFFPDQITDNLHIPPVVITSFSKFNNQVQFEKPLWEMDEIELTYKDYVFSFEFAALDFTAPEMNQYAYKMEGLDENWVITSSKKRFATYTTLAAGRYTFKVIGSNNDGIWNSKGSEIDIIITPPFWYTWWFMILIFLMIAVIIFWGYKRRLKAIRMKIELQAAHKAQMSIMPQNDPRLDRLDISGICLPANEVGGDFFDYFTFDHSESKFSVIVGDVSGKAMDAAMTAVMTSGMINSESHGMRSVKNIMTRVNHSLHLKTPKQVFTAACFVMFDLKNLEMTFTNAGLVEPVLKSGKKVNYLRASGVTYPLGSVSEHKYEEKKIALKSGDLIILTTDGIVESRNRNREQYGEKRFSKIIEEMDTKNFSAARIKDELLNDIKRFSGHIPQFDDMTLVVIKVA